MISTCRLGSLLRAGALGYVGLGAIAGNTGAWLGAIGGAVLGWLWHSRLASTCALPSVQHDDAHASDEVAAHAPTPN